MLNLQDQTHLCHVKVTTDPNLIVAKLSSKCGVRDTEKHYLIKFLVDLIISEIVQMSLNKIEAKKKFCGEVVLENF